MLANFWSRKTKNSTSPNPPERFLHSARSSCPNTPFTIILDKFRAEKSAWSSLRKSWIFPKNNRKECVTKSKIGSVKMWWIYVAAAIFPCIGFLGEPPFYIRHIKKTVANAKWNYYKMFTFLPELDPFYAKVSLVRDVGVLNGKFCDQGFKPDFLLFSFKNRKIFKLLKGYSTSCSHRFWGFRQIYRILSSFPIPQQHLRLCGWYMLSIANLLH